MTIKDLAEMLIEQGYDIKLRKRSDGGYIISRINGVSYKGATGNIKARNIVGAELSHARTYQLARIRPPKRIAPKQRKLAPIPEDLKKELRKVQRSWRKEHPDVAGTISMRGLRYQYEHYGEEMARASLNKAFRYSHGLAYVENIQFYILRWQQIKPKAPASDISDIDDIIRILQDNMFHIREEVIHDLYYRAFYPYQQNAISIGEAKYIIKQLVK